MIRSQTILDGLAVRYYDTGSGPVLLLLHGAGMTARLWRRQMGPLSGQFRVIAPDLPGFGGSQPDPSIRIVRDYAGFAARFLSSLGVSSASVIGSSMGGWAACHLAADRPELVDKLILFAPGGLSINAMPSMSPESIIEEVRARYVSPYTGQESSAIIKDELERAVGTLDRLRLSGAFRADLGDVLPEISARTLIIWGEQDDVIPAAYAAMFNRLIKSSRLELIKDSGHMTFADRPEVANALITNFLTQVI